MNLLRCAVPRQYSALPHCEESNTPRRFHHLQLFLWKYVLFYGLTHRPGIKGFHGFQSSLTQLLFMVRRKQNVLHVCIVRYIFLLKACGKYSMRSFPYCCFQSWLLYKSFLLRIEFEYAFLTSNIYMYNVLGP